MGGNDFKIEDLCLVFPYLEHLQVKRRYSMEQIFCVIDRFKFLSTASFAHEICSHGMYDDWEYRDMQRIYELNCTYRLDSKMVHFWI